MNSDLTTGVAHWPLSGIASDIADERCSSLLEDVKYCVGVENSTVPGWPAPYPALLYCFATIDLFASFYKGRFNEKNTENMCCYLREFMKYDKKTTNLIMNIFRHKLVHTAHPKTFYKDHNEQIYSWGYTHDDKDKHLLVERRDDSQQAWIFWISIEHFATDIDISVRKYIHKLKNDQDLQKNFAKVLLELDSAS